MPGELTNLLPPERLRYARRRYVLRLGSIALILATLLTGVAAGLLLPMYFYLFGAVVTTQARLTALTAQLRPGDATSLSGRLSLLTSETQALLALKTAPTASVTLRTLLAVAHPDISLIGFKYAPTANGSAHSLAITGLAASRDALRNYESAFQTNALIKSVDLPVSSYAKESNIPFTITLTLAL